MDWNPLTWTFATSFFGVSLLKWGVIVGGIIFLALLRRIIIGTRTIHTIHSSSHPAPSTMMLGEKESATPAITADTPMAMPTAKEAQVTKQKVAKVKAFKRAVVVAKKKRKAKKVTPLKLPEVIPTATAEIPMVNVKIVANAVPPAPSPVIVKQKSKVMKPKKKKEKTKPIALSKPTAEIVSPRPIENVLKPKIEAAPPKTEAVAMKVPVETTLTKKAIAKTKKKKAVVKPKAVSVTPIAKEAKQTKAETPAVEEKTPVSTTKPLRTRNPGFI